MVTFPNGVDPPLRYGAIGGLVGEEPSTDVPATCDPTEAAMRSRDARETYLEVMGDRRRGPEQDA